MYLNRYIYVLSLIFTNFPKLMEAEEISDSIHLERCKINLFQGCIWIP